LVRRAMAYTDLRALYWQVLEACARSAADDGWLDAEITRAAALIVPLPTSAGMIDTVFLAMHPPRCAPGTRKSGRLVTIPTRQTMSVGLLAN
jgi:hypothetical protein